MKNKTFTQVFLLFPYKLLCSFLLSFTKIFSFSSKREERGVLAKNSFVGESSPKSNTRFWGDDVIKLQQIASFSKVIALKGRVAIFAVLQNFMGTISANASALLASLKRISLQNTQPGSTAHSRGWTLRGFSRTVAIGIAQATGMAASNAVVRAIQNSQSWIASNAVVRATRNELGRFMSRTTLLLALTLTSSLNGWGQTTSSEINGGSTSYSNVDFVPLDPYYAFNYSQMIYTASELTSAGLTAGSTISGVLFYYAVDGGAENDFDDWVVRLGNTATSTFTSTASWIATSGMTSVYNSAVTFPAANNWMTIDFSSNFIWDGTSNLVIAVDENSAGYENDVAPWRSTEQFVEATQQARIISFRSDSNNPDPASPPTASGTSHWRPVIKLKYTNCPTATTYYSKSTGNLDVLTNWGTSSNGSGCNPANFTTAGITYIVQNNATPTTSVSGWSVSGAGSIVKVGNGSSAITFSAAGSLSFDCNLEITGNATLSLGSNSMTLSGDLVRSATTAGFSQTAASASTVTFSGSSQEVNVTALNGTTATDSDITFNHVIISGSSVKLFYLKTNDRKLNINNFTVNVGAVGTLYSNPL